MQPQVYHVVWLRGEIKTFIYEYAKTIPVHMFNKLEANWLIK